MCKALEVAEKNASPVQDDQKPTEEELDSVWTEDKKAKPQKKQVEPNEVAQKTQKVKNLFTDYKLDQVLAEIESADKDKDID